MNCSVILKASFISFVNLGCVVVVCYVSILVYVTKLIFVLPLTLTLGIVFKMDKRSCALCSSKF